MKSDKFVLIQLYAYFKCYVQTVLCHFHGTLLHHSLIRYHHAINWLSIFCSYCDKQFLRISHGKSTCMRTWGTLGSAHLLSDQDIFMRCLPKWLQSYIFCDNPSSWRKSIFLYKHAVNLYIYEVKHIGWQRFMLFITYGAMVLLTLLYYH